MSVLTTSHLGLSLWVTPIWEYLWPWPPVMSSRTWDLDLDLESRDLDDLEQGELEGEKNWVLDDLALCSGSRVQLSASLMSLSLSHESRGWWWWWWLKEPGMSRWLGLWRSHWLWPWGSADLDRDFVCCWFCDTLGCLLFAFDFSCLLISAGLLFLWLENGRTWFEFSSPLLDFDFVRSWLRTLTNFPSFPSTCLRSSEITAFSFRNKISSPGSFWGTG